MKINNERALLDKIGILVLFWGMVLVDILVMASIAAPNPYILDFSAAFSRIGWWLLLHFAIFILLFSFATIMSRRAAKIYTISISVFFSLLSLFYVVYYRLFNSLPSISMLELINFSQGDMPAAPEYLLMPIEYTDLLMFVNIFAYFIVNFIGNLLVNHQYTKTPKFSEAAKAMPTAVCKNIIYNHTSKQKFAYSFVVILCIATLIAIPIASSYANPELSSAKAFVDDVFCYSPLGGAIKDIGTVISHKQKPDKNQDKEIRNYFKWNASLYEKSQYAGTLSGKNVLYIQMEAFENFVINLKIDGKEVTPNINKLASKGYYFPNVHDQVRSGNSSDCDFVFLTSILPANRKVSMKSYENNTFNSMPNILDDIGYNTTYYCSTPTSNWGYDIFIPNVGYDNFYTTYDVGSHNMIMSYLADESYFEQTLPQLVSGQGSFVGGGELQFAHMVCCSTHAPFMLDEEHLTFEVPADIKGTILGNYIEVISYLDTQIGIFLDELKEANALNNTAVILAGDHLGPHKYYPKQLNAIKHPALENIAKDYDATVPLIIYSADEDITPTTFDLQASQFDIMPTILDLLGVEQSAYAHSAMGKSLVSTSANFAINAKGKIYGTPSKEDKKQLKKAYKIADLILESDYFAEDK